MEDNLIAIVSQQNQLLTLRGKQRAEIVDQIDGLLKNQYNSSYPESLKNTMMQVQIEQNPNLQQFISYLESDQTLQKNDFQKFSQPSRIGPQQGNQGLENAQLLDVRLFSFKKKSISQQNVWEAYDNLTTQIEDANEEYRKEDQINTKTIIQFLTGQADKMFNHTKREALKLPAFLRQIGLHFELTEANVLGFRNLCYGCFQDFKYQLLAFLDQFPLKECRLCVDDVVDFDVDVLGIKANVIVVLRLVIFMITIEAVCACIVATQKKDGDNAANQSKTEKK